MSVIVDKVVIPFNENLSTLTALSTSNWTVTQNGSPVTVSEAQVIDSTIYLTLGENILSTATVRVSYSGSDVTDDAGNLMSAVSNLAASNDGLLQPQSSSSSSSSGGVGGGNIIMRYPPTNTVSNAIGTSTAITQIVKSLTKDLKLKTTDSEVVILQKFLNAKGFPVSLTGAGSKGKETNYFGLLTMKALAKFQKSVGIKPAVGYFGSVTRKFIQNMK